MKLLLRVEEAAAALAISRAEAYRWIAAGKMPGVVQVEGRIRVSALALARWVEELAKQKPAGV
jgi:excisionase family DNA binding protein